MQHSEVRDVLLFALAYHCLPDLRNGKDHHDLHQRQRHQRRSHHHQQRLVFEYAIIGI